MTRRTASLLLLLAFLWGCAGPPPSGLPPAPAGPAEPAQPVHPSEPDVPVAPAEPAEPAAPVDPVPPPAAQAVLSPARVLQGDVVSLRMDRILPGEVEVFVEGLNEQPKVYFYNGRAATFIGFPAHAPVGTYPVVVTWTGGRWDGQIQVVHKAFTEDRLVVTEEQEALYYDPRAAEEWRRIFAVRAHSEPAPLWEGPFEVPLAGPLRVTTYFGEIRFVNGSETGRHSGMDFGVPTGTPIFTPAAGRVVMAEQLIVTGWTIIIDHGYNLFSVYYHCDEVSVTPGQVVKPGDVIGTVGNTGFSTGPHLHWTVTIGNTPVDPWPFTLEAPLGLTAPPDPSFTPW